MPLQKYRTHCLFQLGNPALQKAKRSSPLERGLPHPILLEQTGVPGPEPSGHNGILTMLMHPPRLLLLRRQVPRLNKAASGFAFRSYDSPAFTKRPSDPFVTKSLYSFLLHLSRTFLLKWRKMYSLHPFCNLL